MLWIGFIALIFFLLALDLGVFHRRAHVIGLQEAILWTIMWVVLALAFNVAVFFIYEKLPLVTATGLTGKQAALQFFTGYLIEKSLSVDNIFVIAMIFAYFGVPPQYQHRVLFWGIVGALVMRGLMIAAGVTLINRLDWIVYVFGALLILTAVKLLVTRHDTIQPERSPIVRLARKVLPLSTDLHGARFLVRVEGRRVLTPLALVLIIVENTDLLFAIDSIPAVLAITRDPFIVFTSNVFAILGLRALYFALAGLMAKFSYLKTSLVFLLAFVGGKMLLSHHHPIPTSASLAIIVAILSVGVIASIVGARRDTAPLAAPPLPDELTTLQRVALRTVRRVVVSIVGGAILLVGLAMIVLPGPAFVVIPLGLGVLALEYAWPKALLRSLQRRVSRASPRDHRPNGTTCPRPEPPASDRTGTP